MSGTNFTDMTPTAEKLADIQNVADVSGRYSQHVGNRHNCLSFGGCSRQTHMSTFPAKVVMAAAETVAKAGADNNQPTSGSNGGRNVGGRNRGSGGGNGNGGCKGGRNSGCKGGRNGDCEGCGNDGYNMAAETVTVEAAVAAKPLVGGELSFFYS